MHNELTEKGYIPLDKSWIIRMGILDIINGYKDIGIFLKGRKNLGDDLLALKKAAETWNSDKPVAVGESGTLYRFLKFISWKLNLNKKFVTTGTLKNRKITDNPQIVNMSQSELLKLDNNTSQWASAAVLAGDSERLKNPPFKLKLTYEAVAHWKAQRKKGKAWLPKYDETILEQAKTFLKLMDGKNKKPRFTPRQAEDYCFAFTFGYVTKEEGYRLWPSLVGHESNRIKEMSEMLEKARAGLAIPSKDHRVVQVLAMWGLVNNKKVKILYPDSVNKSWPQFWDFLKITKAKVVK